MTFMTILRLLLSCCRRLPLGFRLGPAGMLAVILPAATLQLRFGVDQVATGNRHLVASLDPGQNLDLVFDPLADLHITWLEHPRRRLHPDHLALAGIDDRRHRNDDTL